MCGLFASFNRDVFKKLFVANSYRGVNNPTVTFINRYDGSQSQVHTIKDVNDLDRILDQHSDEYIIGHIQAPTSIDRTRRHPAFETLDYTSGEVICLWHNGIIKEKSMEDIQKWINEDMDGCKDSFNPGWDTSLLLARFSSCVSFPGLSDFSPISEIDGSFACIFYHTSQTSSRLLFFRNSISPLFFDPSTLSISSVKTPEASQSVPAGILNQLNLVSKQCSHFGRFNPSKFCPYEL